MQEFFAPFGSWPPRSKALRPFWAAATLTSRVPAIASSYGYDLTFLQREILSTMRTLEPFTKAPRILDLDDAVWLRRESQLRRLVAAMDGVVCGNAFIMDWVSRWNGNHALIPTAVDTDRWHPSNEPSRQNRIIGWSGLHAGSTYLLGIERPLARVLERFPDVRLRVVSDRRPDFQLIAGDRIEFVRWSPACEVSTVQEMSVGLMPLHDTLWERGKCSYKMLLYMSCAVPVAVSPIGMNVEVLARDSIGLGLHSEDDWVDGLSWMLDHPSESAELGRRGRDVVLKHYSVATLAPTLANYLGGFA